MFLLETLALYGTDLSINSSGKRAIVSGQGTQLSNKKKLTS